MLVPARLTWLLQPLDTHVFFKFNLYLKQKFAESLLEAPEENSEAVCMVRLVVKALRYVLQAHNWEPAFVQTGLWESIHGVRVHQAEAGV